MKKLLGYSLLAYLLALTATGSLYANDGLTIPPPVFQTGDTPTKPLPDKSPEAQGFIDFFNEIYIRDAQTPLPLLDRQGVVWFPPQRAGDTSLEMVVRSTPGNPPNCNPADNHGKPPSTYPLVCEDDFSTGEFCQACHDSALYVEGGGLPEMMYVDEHEEWMANWSQYGDWSTSIMRLATRDPIWQAQIETETNTHKYADPAVIQDICFSCHGEMGERQLKFDHGEDQTFCTDMFYATLPGILPEENRGKPYPYTGDCDAPILGKSVKDHPEYYAKYGSLARDGVSCETCHRIGPKDGNGNWNGTDFDVFYGAKNTYNVSERQTSNPIPLQHEFTATFQYDMNNIMAPDPLETLDVITMATDDNLALAHANDESNDVSYLKQSVLCGTCHLLIVPQIPSSFKPDAPLPDSTEALKVQYPFYKRPKSCDASVNTFAPATRGEYGNPITDQCVALGYEQATYLEWINSDFASEQDNEHTCQGCHMPLVTDPSDPSNHTAIMAQSTEGLTPKNYRRHRLMGINLPVFEMFSQFPEVLGVAAHSDNVPDYAPYKKNGAEELVPVIQNYLLNGQMAIVEQATSQANGNGLKPNSTEPDIQAAVDIIINDSGITNGNVSADLTIVNNTGHKFPSGAGFRRAFIRFEVLDSAGDVIWVSGQVNAYGAICEGLCNTDGTYNLLSSETPNGNPKSLQPHHSVISSQDQVQIYEVQAVDDTGLLTSRTLSLFHDAKDNRLLPRGFRSKEQLNCESTNANDETIFGIRQCTAFYATEPQLKPLTIGSTIASDPHYSSTELAGSDTISYSIPVVDMKNGATPASIRVSLEYQTIPPGFLAQRFLDGFDRDANAYLPATERSIYLTSHLNTNLDLKSANPANSDVTFSQNWTSTLFQASSGL